MACFCLEDDFPLRTGGFARPDAGPEWFPSLQDSCAESLQRIEKQMAQLISCMSEVAASLKEPRAEWSPGAEKRNIYCSRVVYHSKKLLAGIFQIAPLEGCPNVRRA